MLARTLGIARNTVVHVYEQLTFEGYVQARVGRGTFVADVFPGPSWRPENSRWIATRRCRAGASARCARRWPRAMGAFAPGVPELRMFPIQTWNRLQARVWRRVEPERLSYATGHGDAGLREAIADYLRGTRGIACTPAQVVITSGTQQSLHLVAQLLADPGDRVWLEDPGYWGARSVFHATGLESVAVAVDGEGLAPSAAQWAEPPRLVFVSPSHQYPTGAHMSLARRRQLLDYAAQHGVWVIEDDYDSEFRYDAHPLSALQALDESGRVIYLGTFSKTLFPRCGWPTWSCRPIWWTASRARCASCSARGRRCSRRCWRAFWRKATTRRTSGACAASTARATMRSWTPSGASSARPCR